MSVAGPDRIEAWLDNELSDEGFVEFEDWLRSDPANIEAFARAGILHRRLRDVLRAQAVALEAEDEPPYRPIIKLSPLPSLSTAHYSPSTNFVGGPVFSYMVASVILCMMLLGGWVYKISDVSSLPGGMANNLQNRQQYIPVAVGQVTGMKDCRWGKDEPGTIIGASVPLGRKYSLESGLLQITYKTGANVILEGPCVFKADSDVGGFLHAGKLVARVEKREERREKRVTSGQWPVASAKPQASSDPQSLIPNPLFTVTTPTAVVTDLGTEFGIEVNDAGDTTSHVFRGAVKVRAIDAGRQKEIVLRADESAQVKKNKTTGDKLVLTGNDIGDVPSFVRQLAVPPKYVDLLDIVAGGNGTGRRREYGINPVGGFPEPFFVGESRSGGDQYSPVNWSRFIDGVFVPNGRAGAVRLDSAGHDFDGFPKTSGDTYGPIWPRAADSNPSEQGNDPGHWIFLIGECRQFTPEGRGLLGMCPNVGITFDLQTVRGMRRDARPGRLKAVAGLVDARFKYHDADSLADLWVFIDGRLMMKRMGIRPQDGPIDVDVAIGPDDRFLTLISTDGGNGNRCDWVVVGDPVIEMVSSEDSRVRETHQSEKHRRGAFHAPYEKEDRLMNR